MGKSYTHRRYHSNTKRRPKKRSKKRSFKPRKTLSKGQRKTVKKMIKGNQERLRYNGALYETDLNPRTLQNASGAYTTSDPYYPANDCFGDFEPRFVYGTEMAEPSTNDGGGAGIQDVQGAQISGTHIRYLGTTFTLTLGNNDAGFVNAWDQYFRFMVAIITSPDETETMNQEGWSTLWRHDNQLRPLVTENSNRVIMDIQNSTLSPMNDVKAKRKVIKDTKWRLMPYRQMPPQIIGDGVEMRYRAQKFSYFVPDGKRYRVIMDNNQSTVTGKLANFRALNYALLGTWQNTTTSPDCSIRIDYHYTDA